MTGMNMDRLHARHDAVSANSGMEFADIPKLLVTNGAIIRLIGDFTSIWEHFVQMPSGQRPYYCAGPESDCPLCAAANRLAFSDDPKTQEAGKQIRAKEKFYFNVLDRTPVGRQWHASTKQAKLLAQNEKGMNVGSMLFKAIGDVVNMRRQQGQSEDPNTFDLMLSKSGTNMKTKYGAQFTGDVTPLTAEEKSYHLWPIDEIAKVSPRGELDAVAKFLLGEGPAPQSRSAAKTEQDQQVDDNIPFDAASAPSPAVGAARGPVQIQRQPQQTVQQQAVKSIAVQSTVTAVAQKAPVAAPAPAKPPAKLVIPQQKPKYQSTLPVDGVDPSTHMVVPCSECGAQLMINMEDDTDLQCHKCQKVYSHPSKG